MVRRASRLSTATTRARWGRPWRRSISTSPGLRSAPLELGAFAIMHAALLLVAMAGMRMLRRGLRDFARGRLLSIALAQKQDILLLGELDWIRSMIELISLIAATAPAVSA